MRSWKKWGVALLVPLVCLAVLLATVLPGQDAGKPPANPKPETIPAAGAGAGLEKGTGAGLGPMASGMPAAEKPEKIDSNSTMSGGRNPFPASRWPVGRWGSDDGKWFQDGS